MVIVTVFEFNLSIRALRAGSVMTMVPTSVLLTTMALYLVTSIAVGLSTGVSFVPMVSLNMVPSAVVEFLLILPG
jgi:hypothetical protein